MDVKFRHSEKPEAPSEEPTTNEDPSLEPETEAALAKMVKLIKQKLLESRSKKDPQFQKRQKAIAAYKKNGAA